MTKYHHPNNWQDFNTGLELKQLQIMARMKAGETVELIAKDLGLKINQVVSEYSQICWEKQKVHSYQVIVAEVIVVGFNSEAQHGNVVIRNILCVTNLLL